MKVVFVQEVLGTAIPGEVKDVKNGFARNYLLPRGLAVPATAEALRRAEIVSKQEEKRQATLDDEARRFIDRLEGRPVVIRARAGDQGRLYGSVTAADIAAGIEALVGEEFDRRRILLQEPIRQVGARTVTLRLTRNISHALPVEVEPEDAGRRRAAQAPAPVDEPVPAAPADDEDLEEDAEAEA